MFLDVRGCGKKCFEFFLMMCFLWMVLCVSVLVKRRYFI